ncbi:MAG TPA: Ada metal-binding domain-containing protein, partial [Thermoanaerobaculia bacterium]|nr:Ada metal-binding domain-containing protein [Thermoanaerobaculia bacterium]
MPDVAGLSRRFMIERARARDAAWDGRFYTGVLSTGIFCLPSCPARPPREDNVRFFPSVDEARRAGLRPCLRCRPEDF